MAINIIFNGVPRDSINTEEYARWDDPLIALYIYTHVQSLLEQVNNDSMAVHIDSTYQTMRKYIEIKVHDPETMRLACGWLTEAGHQLVQVSANGKQSMRWILPDSLRQEFAFRIMSALKYVCSRMRPATSRQSRLLTIQDAKREFVTVKEIAYAAAYAVRPVLQVIPFGMGSYLCAYHLLRPDRFSVPSGSRERLVAQMYFYFCMYESKPHNMMRHLEQYRLQIQGNESSLVDFTVSILSRLSFFAFEAYHMPTTGMYEEDAFVSLMEGRIGLVVPPNYMGSQATPLPVRYNLTLSDSSETESRIVDSALTELANIMVPINQRTRPLFQRCMEMVTRAKLLQNYQEVFEQVTSLVQLVQQQHNALKPPRDLFSSILFSKLN